MTKAYKEELDGLEAGIRQLNNRNPKKYGDFERIKHAKEIQEARIDGFKGGYALRDREIKEQKELSSGAEK